jgi:hypothetical protein
MTCANCHGVEYLAELPLPIKTIMGLDDEIRNALRDLEARGVKPSEEVLKMRREFKRQVAEFVHATNMKSALENAARYVEIGQALKQQLRSTK